VSARLGEMLIKVGALKQEQLEQVLNAQAIYGGRLGTNLVEMGLVAEEELARLLNEQLGVPCLEPTALNDIAAETLRLVPRELVQRYRVMPVALEGKRLMLAMADPSDFKAIEEVGFVTGLVIVPRLSSELRLNMALERHYAIKRPVRYIPVTGGFSSRFAGTEAKRGAAEASFGSDGEAPKAPRASIDSLADRFAGASGEPEVVSTLLAYVGGEFDRGGFLTLKQGVVRGVQATGAGADHDFFPAFTMQAEELPPLNKVVQERKPFLGELKGEGAEGKLLEALGVKGPSPALLMPLSVKGQVAAVICANDLHGRLAGGVFELQRVTAMAELTFEMICIRKRIKAS
jgi:hypothetical protein